MTTTVVYAGTGDGLLEVSSNTYATARSGGGSFTVDTTSTGTDTCGQAFFTPTYYLMESFYPFDTSGIPDTDTVSAAVFSLYGKNNRTTTDFTANLAVFDFGASLTSADWQDGTELGALTPVATFATSGLSTAAYNDFTSAGGMPAAIDKAGTTRFVLYSSRQAAGTTPTGEEWFEAWFADNTGTTNDPKLTVTHAASSVTVTPTTASLTTATFAPTVTASDHKTATPSTASLTLATFAPTVAVSDNQTVTPSTATLTLATFAPTVTATDHKTVTPSTASLTLTAFAPTVTTTANVTVTPATAELVLTSFAPTVSTSDATAVTPGTASLTLTTYAPTVSTTAHQTVTPTTASLSMTAFAPDVVISDHKVVTPGTASLALTVFAPAVTTSTSPFDWEHAVGAVTLSAVSQGRVTLDAPSHAIVTTDAPQTGVVTA